jgi:hypothetical protein
MLRSAEHPLKERPPTWEMREFCPKSTIRSNVQPIHIPSGMRHNLEVLKIRISRARHSKNVCGPKYSTFSGIVISRIERQQ